MQLDERQRIRLSDRILSALDLALDQKDVDLSELLTQALEMSLTRTAGGGEFIERRDYPPEIEVAMNRLSELQKARKAG